MKRASFEQAMQAFHIEAQTCRGKITQEIGESHEE
jgi:hypothetical protein